MPNSIRVLFLGDVIGKPGRKAVENYIKNVNTDFKVINGENLAGGIGITPSVAMELLDAGVDVITTGNHVWKKKEMIPFVMMENRVLRPLNYPAGTPGFGSVTVEKNGAELTVVNIEGRIFMNALDCPFRAMDTVLDGVERRGPIIVDFHADATSVKVAMGWFLDGRVSALMGTHTHVQTADERVLPKGSGYITDVGMTGPADSIIGMERESVLEKFLTQIPRKFEVSKDNVEVQGVLLTIDRDTGVCLSIERVKESAG